VRPRNRNCSGCNVRLTPTRNRKATLQQAVERRPTPRLRGCVSAGNAAENRRLLLCLKSASFSLIPLAIALSQPKFIALWCTVSRCILGGVAQLVRASACHAEGCGFEPRRSRHFFLPVVFPPLAPAFALVQTPHKSWQQQDNQQGPGNAALMYVASEAG
jgi:hypothetical protein